MGKRTRPNKHNNPSVAQGTALRTLEQGELVTTKDADLRPAVHVVGLHHTITSERFSHCAFTGKVLRFPAVLNRAGYRVVEYSNGATESSPDEHVQIFSEAQLEGFFGDKLYTHTTVSNNLEEDVKHAYMSLVARALKKRVQPGDIVAHVYGPERKLIEACPQAIHVETGIGYGGGPIGCYRIFESESWRAWHMGHYSLTANGGGGTWPHYPEIVCTSVVPNYYDAEQWALGDGRGLSPNGPWPRRGAGPDTGGSKYLLFVGRMSSIKGIEIVDRIARELPDITVAVITGEPFEEFKKDRMAAPNLLWVGRVDSRAELARWYGGALATLCPSRFHEPFGGVAVESLLCGTPVIASDFAAFTETVREGDGLRCMSTDDFVYAAEMVVDANRCGETDEFNGKGDRELRQERARARFGLDAVAIKYKGALEMFRRQHASAVRPPGHP